MPEAKPIASLTSGLLARKGGAQPAMRRPVIGFGRSSAVAIAQDDLGWNDMGADISAAPAPRSSEPSSIVSLSPMANSVGKGVPVPPVVTERQELAERVADTFAGSNRNASSDRKVAFTLRLEAERHLRLRLACAVAGRSAQHIVTEALDKYLSDLPEIDRLAQQLQPTCGGKQR